MGQLKQSVAHTTTYAMRRTRPPEALSQFPQNVTAWHDKLALKSPGTAAGYFSNLKIYWQSGIKGFTSIDDWVAQVKKEKESNDVETRRSWGVTLESFINSYVSLSTGRPLTSKAKNVTRSAVENYLRYRIGDRLESYQFNYGKQQFLEEAKAKEDVAPVTLDEIRRVYGEAKQRRDRAIISTLMSGFGISEWLQFTREWHKYADDIRNNKVPIRVVVTRQKTTISYAAYLWDDAVEDTPLDWHTCCWPVIGFNLGPAGVHDPPLPVPPPTTSDNHNATAPAPPTPPTPSNTTVPTGPQPTAPKTTLV